MEQMTNGVKRKSGRYPWGTKPVSIVEEIISCELCGEPHIEYCTDGHLSVPHFCESCWKKLVSEYLEEQNETQNA